MRSRSSAGRSSVQSRSQLSRLRKLRTKASRRRRKRPSRKKSLNTRRKQKTRKLNCLKKRKKSQISSRRRLLRLLQMLSLKFKTVCKSVLRRLPRRIPPVRLALIKKLRTSRLHTMRWPQL